MKIFSQWRLGWAVFFCAAGIWADPAGTPAPARVLIIGDSMMRIPAHALELALSKKEGVATRAFTSLGSGLARLDVFDWMAKTRELVEEFAPDMTLVWFGTNDRQPMQTAERFLRVDQPEWEQEYGRRVGTLMDLLTARPGARVIWLELPDMRDSKVQAAVEIINRLVKAETDRRPAVEFCPTRPLLANRPGKYSPYVIAANGMPLQVRDPDGVHLIRAGADRLTEFLLGHMYGKPVANQAIEKP